MIKNLCMWTSLGLAISACSPHVESPPQPHTHAAETIAQAVAGPQQLKNLAVAVKQYTQYQNTQDQNTQDQTRFAYAFVDLNQDGVQDALVLLQSQDWCGSGGCTLLVLKGLADQRYQLISDSTVTDTPIYLLSSAHQGWRDFSVYTRGTGQVLMQFDGQKYPSNPSMLERYKINPDQAVTNSATASLIQPLDMQLFDPNSK